MAVNGKLPVNGEVSDRGRRRSRWRIDRQYVAANPAKLKAMWRWYPTPRFTADGIPTLVHWTARADVSGSGSDRSGRDLHSGLYVGGA